MSTGTWTRGPSSPEARDEAHVCPVTHCWTLCSPGHVSCRYHWRAVPDKLRAPLVEAFRRRAQDPIAYALAVDLARKLVREYAP